MHDYQGVADLDKVALAGHGTDDYLGSEPCYGALGLGENDPCCQGISA